MKTLEKIIKAGGIVMTIYLSILASSVFATNPSQIISKIYVDPISPTIFSGSSLKLNATATDENDVVMNPNPTFSWTSDNIGVVTVDSDGNVRGISQGTATITAKNGSISGTVSINVTNQIQPQVFSTVFVDTLNPTIISGSTLRLISTAFDAKGIVMNPNPSLEWTSDNTGVVTVDAIGNIRGVSQGIATISAKSGSIVGITLVKVISGAESAVIKDLLVDTFNPTIYSGAQLQLMATAFDQTGVVIDSSSGIAWYSDNNGVVTVDGSGMITGVSAGTGMIIAIADGIVGFTLVTVIPIVQPSVPTYLSVDTFNPTMYSGSELQLIATAFDGNGVVTDASGIIWTSDNTGVVTVSPTGVITGVSIGTGMITATFGQITGNSLINVIPLWTSTINLAQGWNMITLPIQAVTSTGLNIDFTAETFGKFTGADVITQWQNTNQRYISHIIGSPLDDFSLTNGDGFFLHILTATGITLSGSDYPQIIHPITSGWNLLGSNNTSSTDANIFGLSYGADVVSKFDAMTQKWTSHVIDFALNNFTINKGDGIFVHKQ